MTGGEGGGVSSIMNSWEGAWTPQSPTCPRNSVEDMLSILNGILPIPAGTRQLGSEQILTAQPGSP